MLTHPVRQHASPGRMWWPAGSLALRQSADMVAIMHELLGVCCAAESTNYHFDVNHASFEAALDRFAQASSSHRALAPLHMDA
jgi:hypothetical protein